MQFPFTYFGAGYFRDSTKRNPKTLICPIVHGNQIIAEYDKWLRENFEIIPKKPVDDAVIEEHTDLVMDTTFTDDCKELLNSLPPATGDTARLAHRLSEAVTRLESFLGQANAQFKAGDTHATFNKSFIAAINDPDM
jgi:hypothetical protein